MRVEGEEQETLQEDWVFSFLLCHQKRVKMTGYTGATQGNTLLLLWGKNMWGVGWYGWWVAAERWKVVKGCEGGWIWCMGEGVRKVGEWWVEGEREEWWGKKDDGCGGRWGGLRTERKVKVEKEKSGTGEGGEKVKGRKWREKRIILKWRSYSQTN